MSERTQKILLFTLAYPACFLFFLVVGAYFTFPYDRLKEFAIQEAERGGTLQLEITSLSPSWFSGVELEGVQLGIVDADSDSPPAEVILREVNARVSLLSLIFGAPEFTFDLDFDGGGTVEGEAGMGETATHLQTHIEALNLGRIGPLRSVVGLPMSGILSGDLDFNISEEESENEGMADLTITGLSVADGETALEVEGLPGGGVTLERLNLGDLRLRLSTDGDSTRIDELHADGEHAQLWGTGSVTLAQPIGRSNLDVLMRVEFKDAYKESSERMEGLFALLEMVPQVRPARTSEGALQWRIQGAPSGRIRMVPSGRAEMPGVD